MKEWFTKKWWTYLLQPKGYNDVSWFVIIRCRIRNHPSGVVWFRLNESEPDMHCKVCGDDLG